MKTINELKSEQKELEYRLRDVKQAINKIMIDDFCRENDISIGDRIDVRGVEMEVVGFTARFSSVSIRACKIKKDGSLYANYLEVWGGWTKK